MTPATPAVARALEAWIEQHLAGMTPCPRALAHEHALETAELAPRLARARRLVARARAPAARAPLPEPPFRLGDLEIVAEAGRGATGIVYRARLLPLGRIVAVKVLHPTAASARAAVRFPREARAAGRLRHPGIVPVLRSGEADGREYHVMPWVEGESLAALLAHRAGSGRRCTRTLAKDLAALLAKVARAVQHAHEHGILHRDVKPANILIDGENEPHLTDFGLAKDLTATAGTISGEVLGSPAYMSPEALRGAAVDARADVYALGATLYEALTLRLPHAGVRIDRLARRIEEGRLVAPRALAPAIPRTLQSICLRALAPERGARYPSARALAEDLEACAAGRAVAVPRAGPATRLRRALRHRRPLLLGCGVAVAAAFGLRLGGTSNDLALAAARDRALELRLAGERDAALAELERGTAAHPQDSTLRMLHALALLEAGRTDAARRAILAAEAVASPLLVRALCGAVKLARREPWLAEDEAALAQISALRDAPASTLLLAGQVLMLAGRHADALTLLRAVPAGDGRQRALAAAAEARCLQRLSRHDEARDAMAAFAAIFSSAAHLHQVAVLSARGMRPEQTRRDVARLSACFPRSAFAAAAELLLPEAKEPATAEAIVARARLAPDWPAASAWVWRQLAALHLLEGRTGEARVQLETLTDLHPHDPDLRVLLGQTLLQLGQRTAGLAQLRRAAEDGDQRPFERDAHWGVYWTFAGEMERALACLRASVRMSPQDPQRLRALAAALARKAAGEEDPALRAAALAECAEAQEAEARLVPHDPRAQQLARWARARVAGG